MIDYVPMVSEMQKWVNIGLFAAVGAAFATLAIGDTIRRRWLRILAGTASSAAFIYVALWTLPYISWLLDLTEFPLLLTFSAIFLGVAAHVFKKQNKLRYGQVEVLVGMLTAVGIAFTTGQSVFAKLISLAAAGYVVARGLNNWDEHLEACGDKLGNRSLLQQLRTMIFEENEEPTIGGGSAASSVTSLPDLYDEPQKKRSQRKR